MGALVVSPAIGRRTAARGRHAADSRGAAAGAARQREGRAASATARVHRRRRPPRQEPPADPARRSPADPRASPARALQTRGTVPARRRRARAPAPRLSAGPPSPRNEPGRALDRSRTTPRPRMLYLEPRAAAARRPSLRGSGSAGGGPAGGPRDRAWRRSLLLASSRFLGGTARRPALGHLILHTAAARAGHTSLPRAGGCEARPRAERTRPPTRTGAAPPRDEPSAGTVRAARAGRRTFTETGESDN
ncbi:putative HTLV-1-related endogenous sequence [Salvelinus sp. IW2-2015]|uniref:putative HTLV-1-related endogenous sequence n=1 Tax=Salvelinus sp. IW2-2015 TaxID=2691554 RepID=UPI0038D4F0A0